MKLPDKLTEEQSAAIIRCLQILAELGEEDDKEQEGMPSPLMERQATDKVDRAIRVWVIHRDL